MKFISFNIRHAQGLDERIDLNRILAVIVQSGADVVALQEVDRFMSRSDDVDQPAELARALQMDWRYAASLRHGRSEYGNAILSRYSIIGDEITFLPGDKERRSLLKVLIDTTDRGVLCVMTTHLGVSERDRTRQVPLLEEQLTTLTTPALLMGDFNMGSEHSLMEGIIKRGWKQVPQDQATVVGGATIDHIFTREVEGAAHAYIIPTQASDHCPVVLEIT